MEQTYLVRIKKAYASDIIEDLLQMEVIELLEEPEIAEWQKNEVKRRLAEAELHPDNLVPWEEAMGRIEKM